ncbi:hypothetical protein P6008_17290 [Ectobacillus antri]|nr:MULTISPECIES: hypothetical protein [Bacteria]MDG4658594.1 hypothetical protein [Ectobacillus antri]
MDDAISTFGVAVDGRRVPGLTSRARNAARVQVCCYGAGGGARSVLAKDLDDDFGLGWDDIAKTPDRFARRVELAADGVAINTSAGVTAITNHAFQASACLPANLLEEESVHRALEADVEFIDDAFRDRMDGHAVEPQVLIDGGDVGLRP